jgi:hypothetical protein
MENPREAKIKKWKKHKQHVPLIAGTSRFDDKLPTHSHKKSSIILINDI